MNRFAVSFLNFKTRSECGSASSIGTVVESIYLVYATLMSTAIKRCGDPNVDDVLVRVEIRAVPREAKYIRVVMAARRFGGFTIAADGRTYTVMFVRGNGHSDSAATD